MRHIFSRISDILTANINASIDQAENPEIMIRQIVRDMEENIRLSRNDVAEAIAAEKRLEKELRFQQSEADKWLRRAETGIKTGNDDMARAALTRKQEHEQTVDELSRSLCAAKQASETLKRELMEMCRKLDEAKRKAISLKARQRAAVSGARLSGSIDRLRKTSDIQSDFNRMASKVADMEAHAEAIAELNGDTGGDERRFEKMEINLAVEDELAVLKANISATTADK